ncbi:MAG: hypothetical protein ABEI98_08290 [Halorhabdus sp.]
MDRGQLYTMEAVIGGLLMFIALLFVIQGLGVTPQSVSGGNQQSVNQQQSLAEGVLQSVNESTLKQTVLYWDPGRREFYCAPDVPGKASQYYSGYADNTTAGCSTNFTDMPHINGNHNLTSRVPPTRLGERLQDHFGDGYSYNVYVSFNASNVTEKQRLVYQGRPGRGATRATRTIPLFDDDRLINSTGKPTKNLTAVAATTGQEFYVPESASSSDIWNFVRVEVVVWGA